MASPSEDATAECFVSVLRGESGGWKANILRWYGQMGVEAPADAVLDALPRWTVCGADAHVVTIGTPSAAREDSDGPLRLMYGGVCPLDSSTVFVKMIGSRAEVAPEFENFEAFCTSLRLRND